MTLRTHEKHFSIEFIQMGARVYVPTLGRFLQTDPVEGGTQNSYVYPSNPINSSDFSGQFGILIGIGAAVLLIFLIVAVVALVPQFHQSANHIGDYINKKAEETSRNIQKGVVALGGALAAGAAGASAADNSNRNKGKIKKSIDYALENAKKSHIFNNATHGLEKLVERAGSPEKFLTQVFNQIYTLGLQDGVYSSGISVKVLGDEVIVRGAMIDGIFEVGTIFEK